MTPTETASAVAYVYAQWPHMTGDQALIARQWQPHLERTPVDVARTAITKLIGAAEYPPTIAAIRTQIQAEYRANPPRRPDLSRPALGAAKCCDWLTEHAPETWTALEPAARTAILKAHADHHTQQAIAAGRPVGNLTV